MRVGLNDLVVEKIMCVLSLREKKNRETIIEEKHCYSFYVAESRKVVGSFVIGIAFTHSTPKENQIPA